MFSLNNIDFNGVSYGKAGVHVINFSLYTKVAIIVDSMDEHDMNKLINEDIENIKNKYLKYVLNGIMNKFM